jgi:hypothetical protein
MWPWSSKDNSFIKYYKSITECFTNNKKVVKFNILAANAPSRIEIPKEKRQHSNKWIYSKPEAW